MKFESPTKFKWTTGCLCCFTIILVNVSIFIGMIITSVVDKKVKDTLVMTSSNVDIWGEVPGRYDIFVERNLTLYNILNPEDLLYSTNPIQVQHTKPIYLRERHKVNSLVLTNDGELANFNQTISYDIAMPKDEFDKICNQDVTIANLYAMGAWDTAVNY